MSARPIASLTVSFGLVAIPVQLYSATVSAARISFNLLHKTDGSRLKQQYVCAKEGIVVDRSEIVKGYEFAKDQYVMFTPEEIKALEEAGSRSIEIVEFVPLESVDPVYFDRTYYLAPDRGGTKPYLLLATALREAGRCAVGRWASHGREYIVILRPMGRGLAMQQLHFAAEVRPMEEVPIDEAEVRDAELKLARQIIDQQTSERFEPREYVDEVRQRIDAAIQKKVEGQQITLAEPEAPAGGKVIDLMAALRASLEKPSRTTPPKLGARKPPKRVTKEKEPREKRKTSRG